MHLVLQSTNWCCKALWTHRWLQSYRTVQKCCQSMGAAKHLRRGRCIWTRAWQTVWSWKNHWILWLLRRSNIYAKIVDIYPPGRWHVFSLCQTIWNPGWKKVGQLHDLLQCCHYWNHICEQPAVAHSMMCSNLLRCQAADVTWLMSLLAGWIQGLALMNTVWMILVCSIIWMILVWMIHVFVTPAENWSF